MRRVCTVLARAGSVGVPGKNVRLLGGVPLIVHSIRHARATGLFDAVVVSTDDPEARRIAEDAGVDLVIERPAELARLQRVCDQACSDDPTTRRSQEQRADQLMIAFSRRCAEARDKLANSEDPATHTPDDQIARQRAFVEQNCRGGERNDLWQGDWIRVGR
jgi:spore coat polysaccharide biosynthesis protein SpsF (cytidylyltransferase family)